MLAIAGLTTTPRRNCFAQWRMTAHEHAASSIQLHTNIHKLAAHMPKIQDTHTLPEQHRHIADATRMHPKTGEFFVVLALPLTEEGKARTDEENYLTRYALIHILTEVLYVPVVQLVLLEHLLQSF